MAEISYARQLPIFDPDRFGDRVVDVVGLGGVGSFLMLHLKKHGIRKVRGHDNDVVAVENPPNQLYGGKHAGRSKAHALADIVGQLAGESFEAHTALATAETGLGDVVFLCVDRMSTRRTIMDSIFAAGPRTQLVVETRVDANYVVVHAVVPSNADHREMWNHFWFPDTEAENNLGCSAPVALGAAASMAADIALSQMIQWFGNGERDLRTAPDNQIRVRMRPFHTEVQQW